MCDHNHHDGGCCHGPPGDDYSMFSLYKFIDVDKLQCLNESVPDSGKLVFKAHEHRKDTEPYVESDTDHELLFNIPFTGSIKLKGIIIAGPNSNEHPRSIILYKNRPFMAFSDVDNEGDQQLEITMDYNGDITNSIKTARFTNIHCLTIYVKSNYGSDVTRIHYIGLQGDFTPVSRKELVVTNYELTPNIADHKSDIIKHASHLIE